MLQVNIQLCGVLWFSIAYLDIDDSLRGEGLHSKCATFVATEKNSSITFLSEAVIEGILLKRRRMSRRRKLNWVAFGLIVSFLLFVAITEKERW